MKNRIKQVRTDNQLTMEQFGNRIGITKSSVSLLESGKNSPSEQTLKLICQEFDVNKEWLLTGNGEMYVKDSQDERYFKNVGKLQRADNETIMHWVNAIAETSPETLKEIELFIKKILGIEDEECATQDLDDLSVEELEEIYKKNVLESASDKKRFASSTTKNTKKASNQ